MQRLFDDTRPLDREAVNRYCLTEEIMMENAAMALEQQVCAAGVQNVLIICGGGNNGADGMVLARRIVGSCNVTICSVVPPKSQMCLLQYERAKRCDVSFVTLTQCQKLLVDADAHVDCIVDCLFGSGFHGTMDKVASSLVQACNKLSAVKIACDVPSGIDALGNIADIAFVADITVTMGALKTSLYSDQAAKYVGHVVCAPLGINREKFEQCTGAAGSGSAIVPDNEHTYLLEESDMHLPYRQEANVNKGSFGTATLFAGNKKGAALIAGTAAFAFGTGIVSLCGTAEQATDFVVPHELLYGSSIPSKTTALALGMGLGNPDDDINAKKLFDDAVSYLLQHEHVGCLLDADVCGYSGLPQVLQSVAGTKRCRVVLTPHPKEFQRLLQACGMGKYSLDDILHNRIALVRTWTQRYPDIVLLLKGARTIIGWYDSQSKEQNIYIDAYGKNCLAKAGSGDVLSGLICALLAQGYSALDAALSGSLAHSIASQKIATQWGMTPDMLIDAVRYLDCK
ncbi:MAG: NAD(P)H-hydrate epimerase [Treponema sp.]|nr:NAD(P)H-hydrate epimerase [Treponema sp.]